MINQKPVARAVAELLQSMGLDTHDDNLQDTPQRVAELWATEFLSGYAMDPAEILSCTMKADSDPDSVFLTDISYHSMCPHHLLPSIGRAHVAYIPAGKVVGFGSIARLVSCFTQRLTLQEDATTCVAEALMSHLDALGAGCVMEAQHLCLAIPGDRHPSSRVITSAFAGELRERDDLRSRLMSAAGRIG